jgi:SAM-dependent methyltransferase
LTGTTAQGHPPEAWARDWAECQEQAALPLFGAALDAARVTRGTRLLDAGCGTGLLALLAILRGATVSALDLSPDMLAVARERLPAADMRAGDLVALPFADSSVDAVVAVNSVFLAADMAAAMRELTRVVRPGGRVVLTTWCPAERCAYLTASLRALGALLPPPTSGAAPGGPGALAAPGALADLLAASGLRIAEEGEVACPFVYPSAAAAWRAAASGGLAQRAIGHAGEAATRAALLEAFRGHTLPDGAIRFENTFLWAAGVRVGCGERR